MAYFQGLRLTLVSRSVEPSMNQGLTFYGFRSEILRLLRCNKSITISSLPIVKFNLISADQTSRMGRSAKWTYHNSGEDPDSRNLKKKIIRNDLKAVEKKCEIKHPLCSGAKAGEVQSRRIIDNMLQYVHYYNHQMIEHAIKSKRRFWIDSNASWSGIHEPQNNIWQNIRNQPSTNHHKPINNPPPSPRPIDGPLGPSKKWP